MMHTRIWWMEVVRGTLSIAFGIAFFVLRSYSLTILISALGAYLVLDGAFDLTRIITSKRRPPRAVVASLTSIVSIVTGIISFVVPAVTLFFVTLIMIVRIIIRGIQVIGETWRGQKHSRGNVLYGILLVLLGLVLLLPPVFVLVIIFLIACICVYSLCDGAFMVTRGLLLRFAPTRARTLTIREPEAQPDIPSDLPPTTRRALIFVRRVGANGLGHVGWSFEWRNGWFNVGSIENRAGHIFAPAGKTDFWTAHTLDPISTMQKRGTQYDEYKVFYVPHPQPKQSWQTIVWISHLSYTLLRHNCSDAVYDVLRSYGVDVLRDPAQEFAPNDWYDALPGASYLIPEHSIIPLHLHNVSKRALPSREMLLTIPSRLTGTSPSWRIRGMRGWTEIVLAFEKMVSDIGTFFVSMYRVVVKRRG